MKILANYRLFAAKIHRTITSQQPITNTNNSLTQVQPIVSQPETQLRKGLKKVYNLIKNFISKKEPQDEIMPLPKVVKERAHRTTIKLEEISEDRKPFERRLREWYLTTTLNKKQEQTLNMLITYKGKDGHYCFYNAYSISSFLKRKDISPSTLQKALDFCKKHPKNFTLDDIEKVNDNNLEVFKALLTEKSPLNDNYLFFDIYGSSVLRSTNEGNQNAIVELIKAKNLDGKPRFDNSFISYIADNINSGNNRAVSYLLDARKSNGSLKFKTTTDWHVLKYINSGNISAVPYLLNHKTKINGKIKHTLDANEFYFIIQSINSDNIKTVPLLMEELSKTKNTKKGILSAPLVGSILKNLKNGHEKAVPEILKIKNPIRKTEYLFDSLETSEFVGEVAQAFCDKTLKGIAKSLLQETPFTISTNMRRYSTAQGIYEYAKMIRDNQYKKQRKFLSKFRNTGWVPHFVNMKEIAELAKALAEAPNKEIIKKIISLKDPYTQKYIYSGFHKDSAIKELDNNTNMKLVQDLLNVTDSAESHSVLPLNKIISLVKKHKRLSQIPIPKILPRDDRNSFTLDEFIDLISKYTKGTLDINELTSLQKFDFKSYLTALTQHPLKENTKYRFNLANLKQELNRYINQTIIPNETAKIHKIALFRDVVSNNPNVEKLIGTFDFQQYGKKGLPLEYPRAIFLADLKNILNGTSDTVKKHILKKLQIQPDSQFTAYEGVIDLTKLNKSSKIEQKVYNICKHFIYQNKVSTGDIKFDRFANSLIQGMPEFINIIGKQPHQAHNYSIDIHILEVLKNCIIHESYKSLSDLDKTRLKMAVLLHDIAKKEGVVDKGHQQLSALYARNILTKYNMPQFVKDDIFFLIQNHHWLEELNTRTKSIEELACNFRNPNDFLASRIFTYADLKSVSPEIFNTYIKDLDGSKAKELQELIQKIKENGNILFTDKIIDAKKIPIMEYKNKKYRVIDLPKLSDEQDIGTIGFFPGTKKDDLKFLVHTVRDSESLRRVEDLSDVSQNGVLSLSYISPNKNSSYCNNQFGVILDENIPDIVNATPRNQGSGHAKDKARLIDLKTYKGYSDSREFLPKIVRKKLNLTTSEYSSLYEQISQKKHITQIQDNNFFHLSSGKTLSGAEIKDAITTSENELLKSGNSEHNEVVGSYLKVVGFSAKADEVSQIPQEYLDFVQEYNIPIYLLGA